MKGKLRSKKPPSSGTLTMVALMVATTLTGCTFSKLSPNASVHLTGTVLDQSGRPVSGAQVIMFKEVDIGEAFVGVTAAIATLGIICLTPKAPDVCASARRTMTDGLGNYSFDLSGIDTQGSLANADNFDISALLPPPGGGTAQTTTTLQFKIQRTRLKLPVLRAWQAPLRVTLDRSGVRTTWPGLPGAYGRSPSYSVLFIDSIHQRPVWVLRDVSSGATLDPRLLEDRTGSIEVDADVSQPGPDTNFRYTFRSLTEPFHGIASPPSRNASCYAYGANQQAVRLLPCRITDGDLFGAAGLQTGGCPTCQAPVHSAVFVDMGKPVPIRLVVVRGASSSVLIEGSNDTRTWSLLGSGFGQLIGVKPAGSAPARYVRVRSDSGLDLSGLTELSVWN